ncbi:DUF6415 family natural product biosynthesis protein [Streptomyces sp. NPDC047860]|uniref:DUF6415 family natural product biosynthesis protein n=1 Tax=Streptomyces sp. NPDC047860 TaxID=3155743 RepID=UPI0033CBA7EF
MTEVADAGRVPQDWSEALELTSVLPYRTPPRQEIYASMNRLRAHAELLMASTKAALEAQQDTADRETARWLLARIRIALEQRPGHDDRAAAIHLEDLALSCRALTVLHNPRTEGERS